MMKNFYPFAVLILLLGASVASNAQSLLLSRYIMATDTITDEGVTFAASSDDAEQENDAIDALFDDDIDAGWEGAPDDQNILTAGLRFRNIYVPPGARIDSAFVVVHSHESKTAEDVARLTIVGDATDNAETFTEEQLIDARPRTTEQVSWVVDEPWGLWTPHRTPDISSIVQEIIDRDGWEAGNAIAFVLLGEDQGPSELENAREWESFENIADPEDGGDGQNYPERVPQLFIYYSVESGLLSQPIMVTDTITDEGVTFAASSDDAEQENDAIDALFDDDIDAGWEGEPDDQNILTAGLRFRDLGIPKGAVIDSAFIEVHSHESKTAEDVARLTIVGDATDNAETFTEEQLIDARPRTTEQVSWVVDEPWGLWTPHRTPDISSIVQEIIDRDGWEAGNAMAFVVLGEDQGPSELENAREWESYENIADPEDGGDGQNYPERVPRLIVYYSSPNLVSTRDIRPADIQSLHLFPNPADQLVNVALAEDAAATIQVYDLNGRLFRTVATSGGQQIELDVQGLAAGVYVVYAQQNGSAYVQRLIIK